LQNQHFDNQRSNAASASASRAYALAAVPCTPLTISTFQQVIQEVLLSQAINRDTLRHYYIVFQHLLCVTAAMLRELRLP